MTILFTVLVLLGFLFMALGALPLSPSFTQAAWFTWLAAAIVWAIPRLG